MGQEVCKKCGSSVQGACKCHVRMVQELWMVHARSVQGACKECARSVCLTQQPPQIAGTLLQRAWGTHRAGCACVGAAQAVAGCGCPVQT